MARSSKKKEKKKKKTKKEKKGESKWRRFVKRFRKDKDEMKKIPSRKLGRVFEHWSEVHHIPEADHHEAAMQLQKQLQQYQQEVEHRRQRIQSNENEGGSLREEDAVLPYSPAPLAVKFDSNDSSTGSSDDSSTPDSSRSSSSGSEKSEKSEKSVGRTGGESNSMSVDQLDLDLASSQSPSISTSTPESTSTPDSASNSEKSISEKSISEKSIDNDKTGQLSNILMEILLESQKDSSFRKEEELTSLSPEELAMLSRDDVAKFDQIIAENTKQCLFLSQPTHQEQEQWDQFKARPRQKKGLSGLSAPGDVVKKEDTMIFCRTCSPRHVNYPFTKLSTRE